MASSVAKAGIVIVAVIVIVALLYVGFSSLYKHAPSSTTTAQAIQPQNTVYVSSSGSSSATGTQSNPFSTISQALAFAKPGYTVAIMPGTYNEQVNITKRITLEGYGTDSAVVNASGHSYGILVSGNATNGTVIENLTVENANNHGILIEDTFGVVVAHNLVKHNGLNPDRCPAAPAKPTGPCINEDKAVQLDGVSNSTVEYNNVTGNLADGGIAISDLGAINPGMPTSQNISRVSYGNKVVGNKVTFNKGGCGIVVASYNVAGVFNNTVENNLVSVNPAGIIVATDTPYSRAEFNRVVNNTVVSNFIPGIIFHSNAPGDTFANNTASSNRVGSNGADPDPTANTVNSTGILVSATVVPITNTSIKNNTVLNEYYGVWANQAYNTIMLGNSFVNVTISNYTK